MAKKGEIGRKKQTKASISAFIVLIVIAIIAVYLLSVPANVAHTFSCSSIYGYSCSNLTYSSLTGNLTGVINQNTGQTWTAWAIVYAPDGVSQSTSGIPDVSFSSISNSPLSSGQSVEITLPVSEKHTPIGTRISGSIWICYAIDQDITGMVGALGTCTPLGNRSATVKYIKIAKLIEAAT